MSTELRREEHQDMQAKLEGLPQASADDDQAHNCQFHWPQHRQTAQRQARPLPPSASAAAHPAPLRQLDEDLRQRLQRNGNFTANDYELLLQLDDAAANEPHARQATQEERVSLLSQLQAYPAPACVEDTQCAICLQSIQKGETVSRLPCSHMFHHGCIEEWLRVGAKPACPICQSSISSSYLSS